MHLQFILVKERVRELSQDTLEMFLLGENKVGI